MGNGRGVLEMLSECCRPTSFSRTLSAIRYPFLIRFVFFLGYYLNLKSETFSIRSCHLSSPSVNGKQVRSPLPRSSNSTNADILLRGIVPMAIFLRPSFRPCGTPSSKTGRSAKRGWFLVGPYFLCK